jgi:molybdopterin synthase sulfur carrier subunit
LIILYFSWIRQKLGTGEERFDVPETIKTVTDLAKHLRARGGPFAEVFSDLKRLRSAVNQEHVGWEASVGQGDEVAFFPPVTGG